MPLDLIDNTIAFSVSVRTVIYDIDSETHRRLGHRSERFAAAAGE